MKYLITESQFDKVIFKYLDNQDFIKFNNGINTYFVNSEKDDYAQIRFSNVSNWCTIEMELMKEVSSFFSLGYGDCISIIGSWVETKVGKEYTTIDVASDIIVRYF